tara:strand:+ start:245 stop:952 length:708 start_codon:yes stop_codon:yes gene_type:complete
MLPYRCNMTTATRVVLFDIDGTLITTGGAGKRAFAQACDEAFGIPDAIDSIQLGGRTDRGIAREILEAHKLQPTTKSIQVAFEAYLRHLTENLKDGQSRVLPGVLPLIDALKALPHPPIIALLTGNLARGAEIKLRHLDLWRHFAWGIFGDTHDQRNALAHDALDMARTKVDQAIHPSELLIIGDTLRDIECARAIGARVLAVATGEVPIDELQTAKPDLLVADLTEVSAEALVG